MRQLLQGGWMHNRTRMIVASFLVKDLLIDWRWGERWFMQQLVDGDPAANNDDFDRLVHGMIHRKLDLVQRSSYQNGAG